MAANRYL